LLIKWNCSFIVFKIKRILSKPHLLPLWEETESPFTFPSLLFFLWTYQAGYFLSFLMENLKHDRSSENNTMSPPDLSLSYSNC
jgi:hypothetical protein